MSQRHIRSAAGTLATTLLCASGYWFASASLSPGAARAQDTPPPVTESGTSASGVSAQPVRKVPPLSEYTVRRTAGPITIDGVLNEPSWQKANSTDTWPNFDGQDPGSIRTQAKVLWDDKTLYVALSMADTDVQASRTVHDSDIFNEDCVELFIDEQLNRDVIRGYLEYEINARGTVFDAFNLAPLRAVAGWDSKGLRSAVKVDGTLNNNKDVDRGWTVEMAIPFFDLYGGPFIDETLAEKEYGKLGPRPGTKWHANFYRIKMATSGTRYITWSPTIRPHFHIPNRFGTFIFSGAVAGEPERPAP